MPTIPTGRIATQPQPLIRPPVINRRIVALTAALAVLFAVGAVAGMAALSKTWRGPAAVSAAEPDEETIGQEAEQVAELIQVPPRLANEEPQALLQEEPAAEPIPAPTAVAVPVPPPLAPAPVIAARPPTASAKAVVVKRLHHLTDEDLRKQLLRMPELSLDRSPNTSARIVHLAKQQVGFNPALRQQPHILPKLLASRGDLVGLPMRMGADCQLGKEPAENLHALSRWLRMHIAASIARDGIDPRLDPVLLRPKLLEGADAARREWQNAGAIPTLQQMLQTENVPARLLLIELLSQIKDQTASAALAQRALFDLSAEVRTTAIEMLSKRPHDEYRSVLLDGFRYPWTPVADHAAEALVALGDREAVPELKLLLDEPDPGLPFQDKNRQARVREVVRINHLGNCLLCHAPSLNPSDLVRGRLPVPGQPLPAPTSGQGYGGNQGIFVRADVTYLRQDFSVPQPVEKPGAWPTMQRYDYLVRTRPVTPEDSKRNASPERLAAIRHAVARLSQE